MNTLQPAQSVKCREAHRLFQFCLIRGLRPVEVMNRLQDAGVISDTQVGSHPMAVQDVRVAIAFLEEAKW